MLTNISEALVKDTSNNKNTLKYVQSMFENYIKCCFQCKNYTWIIVGKLIEPLNFFK
jgi:hypothetical protein